MKRAIVLLVLLVAGALGCRGPSRAQPNGPVWFEDVTEHSGPGRLPGPGLGVVCADLDGDGWPGC